MNEKHEFDNTQSQVLANLPKEEKALFGFATYKQAMIVGIGIFIGFLVFLLSKFILGLFAPFLTKWIISFLLWIITIIPFGVLAFYPVRSTDNGSNSVVLYPLYKQYLINRRADEERGLYLNFHYNHPIVNRKHSVSISNEGTNYDDDD